MGGWFGMTGFDRFWPLYLSAHRRRGTRAAHYAGIVFGTAMAALAAASWEMWPLAVGVGGAFTVTVGSHWVFEGRRPLLAGNPLLAAAADIRMFLLAVAGRLAPEFARHGIEAEPPWPRIQVRRAAAMAAAYLGGVMLSLAGSALSVEMIVWLRDGAWQPISVDSVLRHWGVVLTGIGRASLPHVDQAILSAPITVILAACAASALALARWTRAATIER
jgi:hypothetical protein